MGLRKTCGFPQCSSLPFVVYLKSEKVSFYHGKALHEPFDFMKGQCVPILSFL